MSLLLDHFDLVASAPGGIARLRKLVLELAVRGMLVLQDAADEPASALLAKIKAEKARLVKEGKIKAGKELPEIGEEEKPYELPEGWEWVRLGQIVRILRGISYDKKDASELMQNGMVPLLRGHNIQFTANTNDLVYVPKTLIAEDQYLQDGDLLIAMSSGSANLVGKATRITGLSGYSFGAFCGVVRRHDRAVEEYLSWFFHSPYYRESIMGAGKGIGINNLQKGALESLPIPLPPLAEQTRIAARVQELMAVLDRLEVRFDEAEAGRSRAFLAATRSITAAVSQKALGASWKRLSKDFDDLVRRAEDVKALRSMVLELAVRGRLSPHDAADEPASMLLARIKAEKARLVKEGKMKAGKELPEIGEEEKPYELPKGWEWVRLGEAFRNRDGERIPISEEIRSGMRGEYDYYGASGVIDNLNKYLFDVPLLLVGEDGANLINRSTPIAFIARGKYWVNNHAHVLQSLGGVSLEFWEIIINSLDLVPYVTGTAQPKMNQAKMNSICLPLPPLVEQARIVARVRELMAILDRLETGLRAKEEAARSFAEAASRAWVFREATALEGERKLNRR